jgi:acyl carrier protein
MSPMPEVRAFIVENFLYGQDDNFSENDSFLEKGIIDSTGVLELVSFVEEKFGIDVQDQELVPDNFDSLGKLSAYISRKTETRE